MLPRDRLDLAIECRRMYRDASEAATSGAAPASPAWLRALAREIAEREEDMTRYDLPAEALAWNFETMLWLARWTWRTLEPESSEPPDPEFAPWDAPASALGQTEFLDSIRALAVRWCALPPSPRLWSWVDRLDRRAADLCVRSDLGPSALDESWTEVEGVRIAADEFVADAAATLAEMNRARVAHRDFLRRAGPIYPAPARRLPTEAAIAWIDRERAKISPDALEVMDCELARFGTRPGEVARYARSRLGVVPDDLRVVMRHCRPILSDHLAERPMEPYMIFGRACSHRSFEWTSAALLTERDYFRVADSGERCCDVMLAIREPTVLRIMGSDYVFGGAGRRAWRCDGPEQALCLWIREVSREYAIDNVRWDLGFLKDLFRAWIAGERVRESGPVLA